MNASNSQRKPTSMAVVHIGCLQTGWWPEVGLVAGEWTVFCPSGGGGERALGTYLMEDVVASMASSPPISFTFKALSRTSLCGHKRERATAIAFWINSLRSYGL